MKAILFFLALSPLLLKAQTTSIPDPLFEQAIIDRGWDDVIDGEVSTASIDTVLTLNLAFVGINDLTGIEDFIALESLVVFENYLDELDVSNNLSLIFLNCEENTIADLNVSENVNLERLWASDNNLSYVDLSGNPALYELLIESNFLTTLDLSNNPLLIVVNCATNDLTELNVSFATGLLDLACQSNDLTELDFSNNLELQLLICFQNNLIWLDLSEQIDLDALLCGNNNLSFLNIRNGNNTNMIEGHFSVFANPNLFCIQVDEETYAIDTWTPAVDEHSLFNEACGVSISEVEKVEVNVFPNPTSDYITVDLEIAMHYTLADLSGKIVGKNRLNSGMNSIDLSIFSEGVYFLELKGNNYRKVIKVVIES
jgi:hypothetical protein